MSEQKEIGRKAGERRVKAQEEKQLTKSKGTTAQT